MPQLWRRAVHTLQWAHPGCVLILHQRQVQRQQCYIVHQLPRLENKWQRSRELLPSMRQWAFCSECQHMCQLPDRQAATVNFHHDHVMLQLRAGPLCVEHRHCHLPGMPKRALRQQHGCRRLCQLSSWAVRWIRQIVLHKLCRWGNIGIGQLHLFLVLKWSLFQYCPHVLPWVPCRNVGCRHRRLCGHLFHVRGR